MKTKEILYEWKTFLKKDIINEISIKKFQERHPEFDITDFTSQLRGNTDYLDIINNSIESGQQHSPDDYLQQFEFYKNSIEPNRNRQEFLTINIPGEDESVSLINKVTQGSCTATFDDIQQFQQARMFTLGKGSKSKIAAAYAKVLEEASQNDFELIVDNNDWVIYYPKSIRGSIALARSYWDGSKVVYDNTFNPSKGYGQKIGHMNWCTSVSGSGNMFLNYHRRLNLHMYYCIKKRVLDVSDVTRKICVSYSKTGEEVKMSEDSSATVNANNDVIDENYVSGCLGSTVSEVLYQDAMLPKRKKIDLNSYYKSISLEQYRTLRAANEDNLEDFATELEYIMKYSRDSKEIMLLAIQDKSAKIRGVIARFQDLSKSDPTGDVIKQLASDEDVNIRRAIASRLDLLQADPSGNIMKQLSQDEDVDIRCYIASRYDLLQADPSGDIIKQLAKDEDSEVRSYITYREDLLEADPTGNLIRQLAQDEDEIVRDSIAHSYDISKIQTNTNESLLREYIKSLI